MLRHNHISQNNEPISASDSFKSGWKKIFSSWVVKKRTTLVTTERYEMKIASPIKPLWMIGHEPRLWQRGKNRL
jgi:hypothetical protein